MNVARFVLCLFSLPALAACLVATVSSTLHAADELPLPPTMAEGAQLEEVYADERFFEGPAWDAKGGKLYFTSWGKQTQILRLDSPGKATLWMDNTRGINGQWYSRLRGTLLGARVQLQIVELGLGPEGPTSEKIIASHRGWMGPNDLCETADGRIYFTAPDFGKKEKSSVFLVKTNGEVLRVVSDMKVTNGIITSLDGNTLYVADSHLKHWRSYLLREDGTAGEGRVFFSPEGGTQADPDGMTIDQHGNLYFTGRGGIWAVSPQGKMLGYLPIKEFCSNLTFGGPDGNELYITCANKVYRLKMKVRGGQFADTNQKP